MPSSWMSMYGGHMMAPGPAMSPNMGPVGSGSPDSYPFPARWSGRPGDDAGDPPPPGASRSGQPTAACCVALATLACLEYIICCMTREASICAPSCTGLIQTPDELPGWWESFLDLSNKLACWMPFHTQPCV